MGLEDGPSPSLCLPANQAYPPQQPDCPSLDIGYLLAVDVPGLRAESAGIVPDVDGDLLHPTVEDPDHPAVPTHPDMPAHVFRRDGIIGLLDLHVPVTMNGFPGLVEERESPCR